MPPAKGRARGNIYIYIYIYTYMYILLHIYLSLSLSIHICVHIYIYIYNAFVTIARAAWRRPWRRRAGRGPGRRHALSGRFALEETTTSTQASATTRSRNWLDQTKIRKTHVPKQLQHIIELKRAGPGRRRALSERFVLGTQFRCVYISCY